MQFIAHIFTSIALAVSAFFGFAPHFGNVSLTTLNDSDLQSDFPPVYNDNNAALNNGKIDVGTTSVASITTLANLASIGTITSGVWNGTAIGVAYNGTGTTSPTLNQLMLGNGASGFKVIGFGTSGQSLVSNGAGSAPSWQTVSFDTSQDYTPTGSWNFTGTSVRVKNLSASSTVANPLVLNGVSYNTPSSQGAANTVLTNDGSGGLTWVAPGTFIGTTTASSTSFTLGSNTNSAEMVLATTTLAANTLKTNNFVQWDIPITQYSVTANNGSARFRVYYGGTQLLDTSTNYAMSTTLSNGWLRLRLYGYGSTGTQYFQYSFIINSASGSFSSSYTGGISDFTTGTASIDSTQPQSLYVSAVYRGGTGGSTVTVNADQGTLTLFKR